MDPNPNLLKGLRGRRARQALEAAWATFAASLNPPYDIRGLLIEALDGIGRIIPVDERHAYLGDAPAPAPLRLKVTRTATGAPVIGPNYAGLVTGAPRTPPAMEIIGDPFIRPSAVIEAGGASPMLRVMVSPFIAFRLSITTRRITSAHLTTAQAWAQRVGPVLEIARFAEQLKEDSSASALGSSTQRRALELAFAVDRVVSLTADLGGQALQTYGGYLAWWTQTSPAPQLLWHVGQGQALFHALEPSRLLTQAGTSTHRLILGEDLPPSLRDQGIASIALVPLQTASGSGLLCYALSQAPANPGLTAEVLTALQRSLGIALGSRALTDAGARSYLRTLLATTDLLDAADPYNLGHHRQVAAVAGAVGHAKNLPAETVQALRLAGRLHDLGMVAVSLDLPLTPGTLSETSRQIVQQHPSVGADLLTGLPPSVVAPSVEVAIRQHHEWVNGGGYPHHLRHDDICLEGRILALAEQFVARLSSRSYRPGLSPSRALYEIERLRDRELDGELVDLLIRLYATHGITPRLAAP